MEKIRIGVVGTNFITRWVMAGASEEPRVVVSAVCSRSMERAREFAAECGIEHCYDSVDKMLADDTVDAVYVATPNYTHADISIKAMRAGKHVLCEKPLASNRTEGEAMVAVAREMGVTLMEAMISTLNPGFLALREHLHEAGVIRRYFASYCQYSSRYDAYKAGSLPNAFNPAVSNGALVDIGIYTIYPMVALFGKPSKIEAQGLLLASGTDGQGAVNFQYDGFNATVLYSKVVDSFLPTVIDGEDGNFVVDRINIINNVVFRPRVPKTGGKTTSPVEEKVVYDGKQSQHDVYYYEIAEFANLIERGAIESQVNSHENSLVTLGILDEVRRQLGVIFPADYRR